jgi:hypothetical protein
MRPGESYRDGIRRRALLAVLVGVAAALLLSVLDDDVTAIVLVGVVTALCVALVPTPRESAPRA